MQTRLQKCMLMPLNLETYQNQLHMMINQIRYPPPKANLETREIHLQETYLSHLWSFIYSTFVIYEEGIQKPLINDTFDGELKFDTPLLQRAKQLFAWSISLTKNYSNWDESLPNPKSHNYEKEQFYSKKVNGIFQSAASFLMYHEFAHLTQGHDSFFLGINLKELNDEDFAEYIQIENEADQFAFNMLIKQHDSNNQKWVKGLSIILVICSAILIVPTAKGVKQKKHPDIDNRMLNILEKLDLTTEKSQFYMWHLCNFIIRLFFIKHGITIEPGEFETAQEAFMSHLDNLDEIKISNSI